MKTRLLKLVFYTAFSFVTATAFPQSATPAPQITTATCGAAVCTWNAFGPKTYVRPVEQPREDGRHGEDGDDRASVFRDTFTVRNTATQYKLHITAEERIRAEVFLNGQRIVDEDDFGEHHQREDRANCDKADEGQCRSASKKGDPEIVKIEKVVHPISSNVLAVRLHGKPGTHINVSVIGVDNDPPSIVETIAPPANSFGWNNTPVEILFGCSDATSGIALCPNSVFLTTEGLNQIVAGTAVDLAGNSSTASIQISVDKTPPAISIASPANNATVSTPAVQLTGTVTDALSGVASASCNGTAAVLQGSALSCSLALTQGANNITVSATDVAGNTASQSLSVSFLPITIADFTPTSAPVGTLVAVSGSNLTVNGSPQVVLNQQGGGTIAAPLVSARATGLSFVIPAGAATGPVTVRSGSLSTVSSAALTIVARSSFGLKVGPANVNVSQGKSAAYTVSLASGDGFSQLANLSVSGLPSGMTANFSPPRITAGQIATLTVNAPLNLPVGTANLTITASATVGGIPATQTANATLAVQQITTSLIGRTVESDTIETPLEGITITLLGADDAGHKTGCSGQTLSDAGGNFTFPNLPATCVGRQLVAYNGNTATDGEKYASVNLAYTINSGQVTGPELVHLPRIDNGETKMVKQNAPTDQLLTFSTMPGVVVTVYAGTVFTLPDGTRPDPFPFVGVQVPVDRLPDTPIDGPGTLRAFIIAFQPADTTTNQPVAVVFPNTLNTPPGVNMELHTLDPVVGMLVKYGTGTVSGDGTRIVPDPDPNSPGHNFGIVHFDWHGPMTPGPNGNNPTPDPETPEEADPVDPASGLFVLTSTDATFGGSRGNIQITRTYRTLSGSPGPFGVGTNHNYGFLLDTSNFIRGTGALLNLVMPDGNQFPFVQQPNGVFANSTIPSLLGTTITPSGDRTQYILRLRNGTTYIFKVSSQGPLTAYLGSITDSNGNITTFTRSNSSRPIQITQIIDPVGRALNLAYDNFDRIVSMNDPIGRAVSYTYNGQGTLDTFTDAKGGTTRYAYDSKNRLASVTDTRGITYLQNSYDQNGKVLKQVDGNGGVTTFTYTLLNPTLTVAAAAAGESVNTSPVILTTVTNAIGNKTTYHFSPQGFLLDITDALGQQTIYTRDSQSNQVLSVVDPLNRKTAFIYDANGNVTSSTLLADTRNATTTTFTYDPIFNKPTSITDPLNQTTAMTYDAAGNLTSIVDPLNHQSVFVYDKAGQMLSSTDPLGNKTQFAYANGSLIAITDPLGSTTTEVVDPAGRLLSTTTALGQTSLYVRDPFDQIIQTVDPLGGTTSFTRDANGNVASVTNALGHTTTYTYDPMDRIATRTDALSRRDSYEYDLNGNLVKSTDRRGKVTVFAYDGLNRRNFVGFGSTGGRNFESTITYGYDAASRLTNISDSSSGSIERIYDSLDRLSSEVSSRGSVRYEYDAAGRRTGMVVAGQPPVSYSYDKAGRVTRISRSTSGVSFSYDDTDRISSITLPNGLSTSYSYDKNSRPIDISYRAGGNSLGNLTYAYDVLGRRKQAGGTFARTGLPDPVNSATYDGANELTNWNGTAINYDANGNMLSDGANSFSWNARNQLIALNGVGQEYDSLGRRTQNLLGTSLLYDGDNAVQELSGTTPVASSLSYAVDQTFERNDSAGSVSYLTDALGSTVALIDSNGGIATSYTYDPYGRTSVSGQASSNSIQYAGRENEGNGLYYYRARYYSTTLGRFISEDPLRFAAGMNVYSYVDGHPTNSNDPFGLREGSAANLKRRQLIDTIARGYDGSDLWNFYKAKDKFGPITNKCNKFVYDTTTEGGAEPRIGSRPDWPAPLASEWSDRNTRIPNWRVLGPDETPQPGDVAAYPLTQASNAEAPYSGHSGIIVTGPDNQQWSISAHDLRVGPINTQFYNHPGVVYRRYTGN